MLGKNGVTVNGALHTPSPTPVPLLSKDLITMGDTTFHFLLPFKRGRCSSGPTHHAACMLTLLLMHVHAVAGREQRPPSQPRSPGTCPLSQLWWFHKSCLTLSPCHQIGRAPPGGTAAAGTPVHARVPGLPACTPAAGAPAGLHPGQRCWGAGLACHVWLVG